MTGAATFAARTRQTIPGRPRVATSDASMSDGPVAGGSPQVPDRGFVIAGPR